MAPRQEFADAVGRLMKFWGLKEAYGRVWGCLYLSPDPRATRDVASELTINRGQLSILLKELDAWGAIHRFRHPATGKVVYRAEEKLWKMIRRVFRDRERREVERARHTFSACYTALAKSRDAQARAAARRVKVLWRLSTLASRFLDAATQEQPRTSIIGRFWRIQNALMA